MFCTVEKDFAWQKSIPRSCRQKGYAVKEIPHPPAEGNGVKARQYGKDTHLIKKL